MFAANAALAQTPDWSWVQKSYVSSVNSAYGKATAVDNSGNVYVTGYFSGALNFPGFVLSSSGSNDIYIACYDLNGILQWAVLAGGTGDDAGLGICLDNSGYFYITGYITDNAIFGSTTSTGTGQDIFVAKYNTSGVFQSVLKRVTGGTTALDRGNSIAVDGSGNIYVTGCFSGTENFGISVTANDQDVFILKINSGGVTQWAKKGGSNSGINGEDEGMVICVDASGNPYLTGYISGSAVFQMSPAGNFTLNTYNTSKDIFFGKINLSDGKFYWIKKAGGNYNDIGNGIAISNVGDICIIGVFKDIAFFELTNSVTSLSNSYDLFIAKYTGSDGTFQWVTKAGGANDDYGKDILIESSGNILICGSFRNSCTFGTQTITGYNGTSDDIFIARYSASTALWARPAGGANNDEASSVAINGTNNIYITGSYNTTAYFNTLSVASSGNTDGYTAKFNSGPLITQQPQSASLCAGGPVGFQVTANGITTPLSYQWYHDSNLITGATDSTYPITSAVNSDNGTYYCIVSNPDGSTQSSPVTLTVYPVPQVTASVTAIDCYGINSGQITLTVTNGTTPYSYYWNNGITTSDIGDIGPGVYSCTITDINNCTVTASEELTSPPALDVDVNITEVTCFDLNDGSINLTVSGAVSPYIYLWSNNATTEDIAGLTAGSYSITINDSNNCVNIQTIYLTDPSVLQMQTTLTVSSAILCNGETVDVDLEIGCGLTPYQYLWSNGATTQDLNNITAGCYTVTIYDSNVSGGGSFNWTYHISDNSHVIAVPATSPVLVYGSSISAGDYLGVFYSNGTSLLCGGYTAWTGGTLAITAWADDSSTPQKDGFVTGEVFIWKLWLISQGAEVYMNAIYLDTLQNQGQFASFGMSGVESMSGTYYPGQSVSNSVCISQPQPLQIISQITDVTCYSFLSGSVDLTISGGTTPYSFNWSNGNTTEDLNNVAAGAYQVTVTDFNGCTATAGFNITQPAAAMNSTANIINVDCYGYQTGSIDQTITGGTSPYSFHWNNNSTTEDLNLLFAGNYKVTITDANLCNAIFIYQVTQPAWPGLTMTMSNYPVNCYGDSTGTITVLLSGGTSPYVVSLFPNNIYDSIPPYLFSQVSAGSFFVLAIDANGCSSFYPVTISQPLAPLSLQPVITNINCYGGATGAIDVTPAGGTIPYSYHWNNASTQQDMNSLVSGNYCLTLTDSKDCIITACYNVTQNPPVNLYLGGDTTICSDLGFSIYPGVFSSYLWQDNSTGSALAVLLTGDYSLTVQDSFGCQDADTITVIVNPAPVVNLGNDTSIYEGSAVYLFAGYFPGCSFIWSTGAVTPTALINEGGTYQVTVTNDTTGCTWTDDIILSIITLECSSDAGPDTVVCESSGISLTGSFDAIVPSYIETCQSCNMPAGYCDSYGLYIPDSVNYYDLYQKIVNVQLNGSSNPSDSSLYSDYTSQLFTVLETDSQYFLTVTCWKLDTFDYEYWAFFDWNRDHDFSDINEAIWIGTTSNSGTTQLSNPVNVPDLADIGRTRMRIIGIWAQNFTPCQMDFDGETEDYMIEIIKNLDYVPVESWHGPGNLVINDYQLDINNISLSQSGWYTFTGSIDTICSVSDSLFITVNPSPIADPGNDTTIFEGSNVYLFAGYQSSGIYLWSTGQTSQTIMVTDAGTYSVTVTNSITGCQNTADVVVSVNSTFCTADAGIDTVLCMGGDVTLNATFSATDSVSYTSVCIDSCYMPAGYCPSHGLYIPDSVNFYGLYQKIINVQLNGSSNSSDSSLYSDFTPELFAVLKTDSQYVLNVTCWKLDTFDYQYWAFFDWNRDHDFSGTNEAIWIGTTSNSGTTQLSVPVSVPGNAYLGQTRMRIISIWGAVPSPCEVEFDGETEDYKIEIVSVQEFTPSFSWTGPGGFSSSEQDTIINNISVNQSGYYYFDLSFGYGCAVTDSVLVTVNPLPVVDIGADTTLCDGIGVSVILDAGNQGSSYSWTPAQPLPQPQTITISSAGVYIVTVTVTNEYGCISSDSVTVTINEKPVTQPIIH